MDCFFFPEFCITGVIQKVLFVWLSLGIIILRLTHMIPWISRSFLLAAEWYSQGESHSVASDSLRPCGLHSPWNSPGQNTGGGSLSLLQGNLPNPGIEPRSPTLRADSLPAEPQGKAKSTGMGSLSLLQQIFLTQESNQGLLHCMWILYQLSYQGSPQVRF